MKNNLNNIPGKRIRRQYFNAPLIALYSLMPAIPYMILVFQVSLGKFDASLFPSTLWTSVRVCFLLSVPFLMIWVLNKFFFGKTICVLTEEGIYYPPKTLRWETVEKIEYVLASKPGNLIIYTRSGAQAVLNNAPLYLLSCIKRQHRELEIKVSGISSLLSAVLLIAAIILVCPLYIVLLMNSPGAESVSHTAVLFAVMLAAMLALLPIRERIFYKHAVQYRFWRRILPNKALACTILFFYYITPLAAVIILFYFPGWLEALLLGIFMGVIQPPIPSKHVSHYNNMPTYERLYDIYISHADSWEKKTENPAHKE